MSELPGWTKAMIAEEVEKWKATQEAYTPPVQPDPSAAIAAAFVMWLDENVRRCGHGYIHVTCGDCSPLRVGQ